jgi:hypothetical protein|tara:strand:+ start:358 stop:513 length:156 start_codon:yes stop_codon:yes gene_type:complete
MNNEDMVYKVLKEIGLQFNGRTEGDGFTTIQVGTKNFIFDRYGNFQGVRYD